MSAHSLACYIFLQSMQFYVCHLHGADRDDGETQVRHKGTILLLWAADLVQNDQHQAGVGLEAHYHLCQGHVWHLLPLALPVVLHLCRLAPQLHLSSCVAQPRCILTLATMLLQMHSSVKGHVYSLSRVKICPAHSSTAPAVFIGPEDSGKSCLLVVVYSAILDPLLAGLDTPLLRLLVLTGVATASKSKARWSVIAKLRQRSRVSCTHFIITCKTSQYLLG